MMREAVSTEVRITSRTWFGYIQMESCPSGSEKPLDSSRGAAFT